MSTKNKKNADIFAEFFPEYEEDSPAAAYTLAPEKIVVSENVWVNPGDHTFIQGRSITGGFFYKGNLLSSLCNCYPEPALIDPTLIASEAATNGYDSDNNTPFYYNFSADFLDYSELDHQCRGAYLDWLASERNSPYIALSYLLFYLMGLERRVLWSHYPDSEFECQPLTDDEYLSVFNELLRLQNVYQHRAVFNNKCTDLVCVMVLLRTEQLTPYWQHLSLCETPLSFATSLAIRVKQTQTINASLALTWLSQKSRFLQRSSLKRCHSAFTNLFHARFTPRFGDGIKIKPNRRTLQLWYEPVNKAYLSFKLTAAHLPDPSKLQKPLNNIIEFAEACLNDLRAYSRYLSKEQSSENDIDAIVLLPNELATPNRYSTLKTFSEWAQHCIRSQQGITSITSLMNMAGRAVPERLNKPEHDFLAALGKKTGMGYAPTRHFQTVKLTAQDNIALYSCEPNTEFAPTEHFLNREIMLRLSTLLVTRRSPKATEQTAFLQAQLNQCPLLNQTEKQVLKAFLLWLLSKPANIKGIKKALAKITASEKQQFKTVVIHTACCGGHITPWEMRQFEKIYTLLFGNSRDVSGDIHAMHTGKETTLQTAQNVELHHQTLQYHEAETAKAQAMLSRIFEEDSAPSLNAVHTSNNKQDGSLDSAHTTLLQTLLTQGHWPRSVVDNLCGELNLMTNGAIETLNDWAFEQTDAPLIDDTNDICIDMDIANELKG